MAASSEGQVVYVLTSHQPHPETRVDHGAEIATVISVHASKEGAENQQPIHLAKLQEEFAKDDGYDSWEAWKQDPDFYDPFDDLYYHVEEFKLES